MKYNKSITYSTLIFLVCILMSSYQNNSQTDPGPLYAPFINNKWEFYAIGDSSGAIAYHYDPPAKYSSNPVYIYFREDKQLAAYTRSGVIGYYDIIDTNFMLLSMGIEKNLMPPWAECLRRHGRANTSAKRSRYAFTDSGLLIHFTIKGTDSTFIFIKQK